MEFELSWASVKCTLSNKCNVTHYFSLCILFWMTGGKHNYYWLIWYNNSKTSQYQMWMPQISEELLWKQSWIKDMIHDTNSTPSICILVITPSCSKRWTAVISISNEYLQINILRLCLWLKVMHAVGEIYDILWKHILKCIVPNQSIQRTPVKDSSDFSQSVASF